jgi:hypothetical protein
MTMASRCSLAARAASALSIRERCFAESAAFDRRFETAGCRPDGIFPENPDDGATKESASNETAQTLREHVDIVRFFLPTK